MTTSATTGVRLSPNFKSISNSANQKTTRAPQRQYSLVVWVTLIGIFFPQAAISLGDINVTPGRFVVILLFVPALIILLKRERNRVASDFFAVGLAAWMLGSSYLNGGFRPYV